MTLDQLQRARVVFFAHEQAAATGSLAAMKAVCYVVRNRVRAGWHDGSWIDVIEHHPEVAGNERQDPPLLDVYNRSFQMLTQAIDDIYYAAGGDETERATGEALYYQFMDRPLRGWFTENIIRHPAEHPLRATIGSMVLFD